MNIFIAILLLLGLAGAFDKVIGGRLGLAVELDRGLATMGSLALSMAGIYCIAVTALGGNPELIAAWGAGLPFDSSLLAGVLLAPDLGGQAIALQLAKTPQLAAFTGLLVSSTLGCLVSFVLPISLGALQAAGTDGCADPVGNFMNGVVYGILVLPLSLFVGGLLLGLPLGQLAVNTLPLLLLCLLLSAALRLAPRGAVKVLSALGQLVRVGGILLFCLVTLGVFLPQYAVASPAVVNEVLVIIFKITVVVCGSMVASQLILRYCKRQIDRVAGWLGVNEYAVVGLIISLFTSISMLPLYGRMDRRGQLMNAAFTVSGAFVLGGQLAFVATVAPPSQVWAYLGCKLLGGVLAVVLLRVTDKD
ncbi:MAG: ethanolamine utilization protein EutH [Angelakisella sp.]